MGHSSWWHSSSLAVRFAFSPGHELVTYCHDYDSTKLLGIKQYEAEDDTTSASASSVENENESEKEKETPASEKIATAA